MRRPSLVSRAGTSTALAVVCAASMAGCVHPKDPSVAVTNLRADIVFGVKPRASEEAAPANFTPPDTPGTAAVSHGGGEGGDLLLPPQVFAPAAPKSFPRPSFESPALSVSACPDAALNAFPEEQAPLNVPADRLPAEGSYRWKRSGTVDDAGPPKQTSEITGLEQRVLRKVTKEAADPLNAARQRYSFEVVQPLLGTNDVAYTTYRVDTAARNNTVFNPVGGGEVRQGEPERGVVLKSTRVEDINGNKKGAAFTPSTGLLLLPLPVDSGETFTSVAVDPGTQQTWRYDAKVVGRERVDACGEIIDGWRVDGDLQVSGSGGGTRKFGVIVAPQLGGMVIGEFINGAYDTKTVALQFNVGQKSPDPVTEQAP